MLTDHEIYEPGQYVRWYEVWIKTGSIHMPDKCISVLAISAEDAETAVIETMKCSVSQVIDTYAQNRVIITEAARGHNMDLISKICRPHRSAT